MNLRKNYKEILLVVLFVMVSGLYGLFFYYYFENKEDITYIDSYENSMAIENEKIEVKEASDEVKMFVEVKGEVKKPGVYAATKDTIINTIIDLAGGFTVNAYTKNINLSKIVSNEMVIYVYSKYEYSQLNKPNIVYVEKECNCPKYDISSCLNEGSSIINKGENNNESSDSNLSGDKNKININTADKEELTKISGIGDSKAQSIIDYRNKNGLFTKIEDITKVSGISDNTFEKIKDYITV